MSIWLSCRQMLANCPPSSATGGHFACPADWVAPGAQVIRRGRPRRNQGVNYINDPRTAARRPGAWTPCGGDVRQAIPAPDRFWPKVRKTDTCWLWTASLDNHGYGAFRVSTRNTDGMVSAHRFAYELACGAIPDGLQLDHLCRVRHCVNPSHLEPVTNKVNSLRGESPAAVNARRTECVNGHEFTEANTRWLTTGKRRCRTCHSKQSSRANRPRRTV